MKIFFFGSDTASFLQHFATHLRHFPSFLRHYCNISVTFATQKASKRVVLDLKLDLVLDSYPGRYRKKMTETAKKC